MKSYQQEFYDKRHAETVYAADTILSILLPSVPAVTSAIDVGCGVGTWLAVLQQKGVQTIQGVDGNWVDSKLLVIPQACFKQVDLSRELLQMPRKYDLAISLEVAEHLAPEQAADFVASLTALSDRVLFSAAVPYQRGRNHINEQWQDYWASLFEAQDYVVQDFIRARIWNNDQIPFWYRQNILLFSRKSKETDAQLAPAVSDYCAMPLNVVHPELYTSRAKPQFDFKAKFRKYFFRRSE